MISWFEEHPNIGYLFLSVIALIAAFLLSRIASAVLRRFLSNQNPLQKADTTSFKFLNNAITLIIFSITLVAVFYCIPPLKKIGVTFFAGAGILTIVLGFASQQALSNIIGGIFIVIFKPFRVNDIVEINGKAGEVEDITLRHTVIKNFESKRIVIPNSVVSSETILNFHIGDSHVRNFIEIGIDYTSNIDLARSIIQEESTNHPFQLDMRTPEEVAAGDHEVTVRLISLGDSAMTLRAYVWSEDPEKGFSMKCDLYESIKKRFDQEGISIPFPHRTIVYKNKKEL